MKIEEQVLSREQMAHLEELGVDTSDASMAWVSNSDNPKADDWTIEIPNEFLEHYYQVPAYTIGDLIEKLPKQISRYNLSVCWKNEYVEYDNWISEEFADYIGIFNFEYRPLIEALYDCLCWIAENHKELIK